MLHRIREAMQDKTATKLAGEVEVDESFIGGKARNMHAKRRERSHHGYGRQRIRPSLLEWWSVAVRFVRSRFRTRRKHELQRQDTSTTSRLALRCSVMR